MEITSTAIVRKDHSFQSVTGTVLNYAGAFKLQYEVLLAERCNKNIAGNIMPSRYLPKQTRSFYVCYVMFGRLMTRNAGVSALVKSLYQG